MNQEIIKTLSLYAVADLFDAEALQDVLYNGGASKSTKSFASKTTLTRQHSKLYDDTTHSS